MLAVGCATTTLEAEEPLSTVLFVVDGDTIRISLPDGSEEPVRLIGINAPEHDECFGQEASEALSGILRVGESVSLLADVSDRDQYQRLLRYVYLEDGSFVNEEMVLSGHAYAREYPPDTGKAPELAAAQVLAQRDGAGLWSACP